MRIAITHPYAWPEVRRGAERIIMELSRALTARGHDVSLFTSGRAAGGDPVPFKLIKSRRLFTDRVRHERYFAADVARRLAVGHFDVVHSMMPYDAFAAVATRSFRRHKVIYQELGIPHRVWWEQQPDRRVRMKLVNSVDVYGCMSNAALEVLAKEWGRAGTLLPGGVRLDEFTPSDREPRPTILFSGALDASQKGGAELLAAAQVLIDLYPDLAIWLSGPGDPAPLLAGAPPDVVSHIEVLPLGTPHTQGSRYSRAWLTALPSRGDSFGLVLVESLASGTPIVVFDDGAPPELVISGENGVVARSLSPEALAASLADGLMLASAPLTSERCRASARRFDWDLAIAPLVEDVYSSV